LLRQKKTNQKKRRPKKMLPGTRAGARALFWEACARAPSQVRFLTGRFQCSVIHVCGYLIESADQFTHRYLRSFSFASPKENEPKEKATQKNAAHHSCWRTPAFLGGLRSYSSQDPFFDRKIPVHCHPGLWLIN
jgi:hypothetical protein